MTHEEIKTQNLKNLTRVIAVMREILEGKDLTLEESARIRYCSKLIRDSADSINQMTEETEEENDD